MKVYIIERDPEGDVTAWVDDQGVSYPLPHLVQHSPDGFEFGYGGSGPSDLARSIVGDYLNTKSPDPVKYQAVKWALIADVPRDTKQFTIRADRLDEFV